MAILELVNAMGIEYKTKCDWHYDEMANIAANMKISLQNMPDQHCLDLQDFKFVAAQFFNWSEITLLVSTVDKSFKIENFDFNKHIRENEIKDFLSQAKSYFKKRLHINEKSSSCAQCVNTFEDTVFPRFREMIALFIIGYIASSDINIALQIISEHAKYLNLVLHIKKTYINTALKNALTFANNKTSALRGLVQYFSNTTI